MDLWEVIIIGFRRWYVMVPLLVLCVLGAIRLSDGIDPVYKTETEAIYLSPNLIVTETDADLLDDGEELPPTEVESILNPLANRREAALLQKFNVESTRVKRSFEDAGLSTTYTVTVDRRDAIVQIAVEASSSDQAVQTLVAVTDYLVDDLDARQAEYEIDPRERVQLSVIPAPDLADPDYTSATRTRFILFGLAGIVAFGAAVGVESLTSYLKRRNDPEADPNQTEATGWPAGMLVQVPPGWAPPSYPRPISSAPQPPTAEAEEDTDLLDDDPEPRPSGGSRWRRAEG